MTARWCQKRLLKEKLKTIGENFLKREVCLLECSCLKASDLKSLVLLFLEKGCVILFDFLKAVGRGKGSSQILFFLLICV